MPTAATITIDEALSGHSASTKAYAASVVAAAPPVTPEIAAELARLLYGGPEARRYVPAAGASEQELDRQRKADERASELKKAKSLAESLTACDVCDLQPEAHDYQQAYGAYHEWQPGRAARLLKRKTKRTA